MFLGAGFGVLGYRVSEHEVPVQGRRALDPEPATRRRERGTL